MWLLHIQLEQLTAKSSTVHISQVMKTARALSAIGNIPQVFEQAEIIRKVQEPEFWKEVNLSDLEKIRLAIRDLLQFWIKQTVNPTMLTLKIVYSPLFTRPQHFCRSTIFGLTMKKLSII